MSDSIIVAGVCSKMKVEIYDDTYMFCLNIYDTWLVCYPSWLSSLHDIYDSCNDSSRPLNDIYDVMIVFDESYLQELLWWLWCI